ncbi:uncharacterized protein LOC124931397 [Impatiens glandulifera]|uniref:Uncharacterized protein LOC111473727 n=1 Tax=Cucurbita maxima TaxID=3661 RepID=A0A6J1ICR4_CUCMA|nr:uncharacterized protein LOC110817417 [Carica papaya]XP_022974916.1 uncharacterized protein LOC111473727 [Cucurbita maxima]XP_023514881.1 uncharacterized protein LOC111779057 [Cucurbita pepo subsp. pepo]XP_028076275.1 uncharacterized protein LOC114278431 [Camellia sinensis]XP_031742505.1 uncharacterized protein LOC116404367 [Cucumis sativus]XP_047327806.1 uncharacterized protein LOC124931397 [Impatiens glandulifera]
MMAVGQVCPHRLVVQDISLSRRQRGFDFPWG